jgi:hypothetical protein
MDTTGRRGKVVRTFDADLVSSLINHPTILPWVSFPGQSEIDLTDHVMDDRNYALKADAGVFFLHCIAPGIYEAHSLFLPEGRGHAAKQAAIAGMAYMFGDTDCEEILARCPKGNLAVLVFTRSLKFEFLSNEPEAWPTAAGLVDQKWFRMTRDRWSSLYGE